MTTNLESAFRYWRERGSKAQRALELARNDCAENTKRYASKDRSNGLGAVCDGLRWCENPQSIGLRFVGFADKLAGRSIDHTGWYTDEFGDSDNYRGAVYQFPARNGRERLVVGFRHGSESRKNRTWIDASGNEAARLDFSDIIEGAIGGNENDDSTRRDCAYRADSIAENHAEKERDWQKAWHAGREYSDLGEEIAENRKSALALIAEIKNASKQFPPAICAVLREHVTSHLESIKESREKRDELRDSISRELESAFNDGAGLA